MNLPILPHDTIYRHIAAGRIAAAVSATRRRHGVTEVEAAQYVSLYLP